MDGDSRDLVVKPPVRLAMGAVVIAGLFYVMGQYVSSQPQRVQQEVEAKRELTVQGQGEVLARPDIARMTLSVETGVQPTAKDAMTLLSRRFDAVVGAVKGIGIKEEDIKTTNLSIGPRYDFTDGRQVLRGFAATESVEVKIRDLGRIGDVLARTTVEGVNQAGGLSFAIDDPESLQLQAQEEAIANAHENAKQLARALDVGLGRVKTFSVVSAPEPPIYQLERAAVAEGAPAGPPVPAGTQEIIATVSVTYELR